MILYATPPRSAGDDKRVGTISVRIIAPGTLNDRVKLSKFPCGRSVWGGHNQCTEYCDVPRADERLCAKKFHHIKHLPCIFFLS